MLLGFVFSCGVVRPVFRRVDEAPGEDFDFDWVSRLDPPELPFSFWEASTSGFGDFGIDAAARSEPSLDEAVVF